MEVDPNPETVKSYKVEGVPALRLFGNKKLLLSHEGSITLKKLVERLEAHLAWTRYFLSIISKCCEKTHAFLKGSVGINYN